MVKCLRYSVQEKNSPTNKQKSVPWQSLPWSVPPRFLGAPHGLLEARSLWALPGDQIRWWVLHSHIYLFRIHPPGASWAFFSTIPTPWQYFHPFYGNKRMSSLGPGVLARMLHQKVWKIFLLSIKFLRSGLIFPYIHYHQGIPTGVPLVPTSTF